MLLRVALLRSSLLLFLVLYLFTLLLLHLIQVGQAFIEFVLLELPTEAHAQLAQVVVNLVQLGIVDERGRILHLARAVPAR